MDNADNTPEAPAADTDKGLAPEQPAETFSLEYVQQLRNEAAKYRNDKKSAVEAAKAEVTLEWEAKLAEEQQRYADLESKLSSKELDIAKLLTAINLEVPTNKLLAFADLIKGDDEESLKESAKSVLDLVGGFEEKPAPATDPTQGKGGRVHALNSDGLMQAVIDAVGGSR